MSKKDDFDKIYQNIKYCKVRETLNAMRTTEEERIKIEDAFDELYEEAVELIK